MGFSFLKKIIYLFLERGREGEREGEKHQYVVASSAPPTGDLAYNPGMYPDWETNGDLLVCRPARARWGFLCVYIFCTELNILNL